MSSFVQLSIFDSNSNEHTNDIRYLTYVDFKDWMQEKFPMFEETIQDRCFALSKQSFRFEWGKKGKSITIRNFIDEESKGQRISLVVETSKTSGYGTWCAELDELEEKINHAFSEVKG